MCWGWGLGTEVRHVAGGVAYVVGAGPMQKDGVYMEAWPTCWEQGLGRSGDYAEGCDMDGVGPT